MNDGGGNFGFVRAEDGFGVHLVTRNATCSVVFAFDTGELWTIDTFPVATIRQHPKAAIPLDEIAFTKKLEEFSTFLERLGIARPHRWIAGIDGLKGLGLWLPPPRKVILLFLLRGATVSSTVFPSRACICPVHPRENRSDHSSRQFTTSAVWKGRLS